MPDTVLGPGDTAENRNLKGTDHESKAVEWQSSLILYFTNEESGIAHSLGIVVTDKKLQGGQQLGQGKELPNN